ncbi:hypothetical protein [Tolypothrix sp. VBCCA 56010]|uniref:hypothetical protein n=1 Tax=Tolypothrix sp. VBCCA 56010 TaxID=3137731 RepID=UPI003D7E57A2
MGIIQIMGMVNTQIMNLPIIQIMASIVLQYHLLPPHLPISPSPYLPISSSTQTTQYCTTLRTQI